MITKCRVRRKSFKVTLVLGCRLRSSSSATDRPIDQWSINQSINQSINSFIHSFIHFHYYRHNYYNYSAADYSQGRINQLPWCLLFAVVFFNRFHQWLDSRFVAVFQVLETCQWPAEPTSHTVITSLVVDTSHPSFQFLSRVPPAWSCGCLLYTSDAADE